MKLKDLFKDGRQVFTFEVFPPKKDGNIETIYKALDGLQDLKPDFISVTYGAGGNLADSSTADIAADIKHKYGIESAAHLTCVNNSRDDIDTILAHLHEKGVENILALRGDVRPDQPPKEDFHYASELISHIRAHGGFGISAACYPEGHPASATMDADIDHLKHKVDCGAEHLVSQLFFDNAYFYNFLDKARAKGINTPIEAGIMPVTNKKQIERMVTMCGASLPPKFAKMMQRYEAKPEALRDAGIAYAVDQIVDLMSQGVDGIHLYTMNNPYIARKISESIASLRG